MAEPALPAAARADRSIRTGAPLRILMTAGVYVAVAALVLVGAVLFRGRFLSADSALAILRQTTLIGMVAVGTSFVTMCGRYVDLSIPSLMATVGFITVWVLGQGGNLALALAAGLGAGALLGGINGWIVGYLRLNPIIWTLAMNFLLIGLLRWAFAGRQVYPDTAHGSPGWRFLQLSEYELPGRIPLATALLFLLVPLAAWTMNRTLFGRQVRFTGAANDPALLSGVDVRRVVLKAFVISGVLTALAAVFLASRARAANFELGDGRDFSAITAVVLGGVMLSGGSGHMWGVVGGVLLTGVLERIVTLAGGDVDTIKIVNGCVFILVVGTTSWLARKGGRSHG